MNITDVIKKIKLNVEQELLQLGNNIKNLEVFYENGELNLDFLMELYKESELRESLLQEDEQILEKIEALKFLKANGLEGLPNWNQLKQEISKILGKAKTTILKSSSIPLEEINRLNKLLDSINKYEETNIIEDNYLYVWYINRLKISENEKIEMLFAISMYNLKTLKYEDEINMEEEIIQDDDLSLIESKPVENDKEYEGIINLIGKMLFLSKYTNEEIDNIYNSYRGVDIEAIDDIEIKKIIYLYYLKDWLSLIKDSRDNYYENKKEINEYISLYNDLLETKKAPKPVNTNDLNIVYLQDYDGKPLYLKSIESDRVITEKADIENIINKLRRNLGVDSGYDRFLGYESSNARIVGQGRRTVIFIPYNDSSKDPIPSSNYNSVLILTAGEKEKCISRAKRILDNGLYDIENIINKSKKK